MGRSGTLKACVAVLALLPLLMTVDPVAAKKPVKPDPEPSMTNPALVYGVGATLMMITSDGTVTEQVASGGKASIKEPAWTPDGARIGYQEVVSKKGLTVSRDLYTVKIDGSDDTWMMSIKGNDWEHFQWFLDDTRIFAQNRIFDIASGTCQVIDLKSNHGVYEAVGYGHLGPDLDPDAEGYQGWVAYDVRAYPLDLENRIDIWVARLQTDSDGIVGIVSGSTTRLSLPGSQSLPTWSPDGESMVFRDVAYDTGAKTLRKVGVTLDTAASFGTPSLVMTATTGGFLQRPAWSPDSKWLALYWITEPGSTPGTDKGDIYLVRPDGTGLRNLTNDDDPENAPDWNPAWVNDLD